MEETSVPQTEGVAEKSKESSSEGSSSQSSRAWIRPVALVVAVLVLVLAGVKIFALQSTSATSTNRSTPTPSSTQMSSSTPSPKEEKESEEPLVEAAQGFTQYSGSGEINILLLGSDSRTTKGNVNAWSAGDARSDSIMLVQISPNRQHITVMSFPRNMAATIPGYGDTTLVNIAYERGGVPLSIQTIQEMTGVRIDYWVLTDFQAFMAMVDAVGGINLDSVQEGSRWYNGWDALKWVRQRKALPNGDIDRVRRHQAFMRALHAKMLTPDALASVGGVQGLYNLLKPYVATNMGAGTAVDVAGVLASVPGGNITYVTMPYANTVRDASGYYMLNPNWSQAAPLVQAFKQGKAWEYVQSHSLETLNSRAIQ
ncbi:MAG: LCP family protein [Actinomycetaceae bacterium]|nr:LCP family protein [Actinomycetaceae bacterium]